MLVNFHALNVVLFPVLGYLAIFILIPCAFSVLFLLLSFRLSVPDEANNLMFRMNFPTSFVLLISVASRKAISNRIRHVRQNMIDAEYVVEERVENYEPAPENKDKEKDKTDPQKQKSERQANGDANASDDEEPRDYVESLPDILQAGEDDDDDDDDDAETKEFWEGVNIEPEVDALRERNSEERLTFDDIQPEVQISTETATFRHQLDLALNGEDTHSQDEEERGIIDEDIDPQVGRPQTRSLE